MALRAGRRSDRKSVMRLHSPAPSRNNPETILAAPEDSPKQNEISLTPRDQTTEFDHVGTDQFDL
jgi:hypothetical protein